jgi:ArsR family transcriptional regulator
MAEPPLPVTWVFKALSDPTRLRIVRLLLASPVPDLCVCEMVDALEVPEYQVSRHLAVLRAAGLVRERRDGKWVYYRPADRKDAWQRSLYKLLQATPAPSGNDQKELSKRLQLRKQGRCLIGIQKERFR